MAGRRRRCTTAVVVFSTIRGLVRGFEPIGDNALIELRAWDVFTSDRPLLGTWSSASVATGLDVNHPGPLLFDYFALPGAPARRSIRPRPRRGGAQPRCVVGERPRGPARRWRRRRPRHGARRGRPGVDDGQRAAVRRVAAEHPRAAVLRLPRARCGRSGRGHAGALPWAVPSGRCACRRTSATCSSSRPCSSPAWSPCSSGRPRRRVAAPRAIAAARPRGRRRWPGPSRCGSSSRPRAGQPQPARSTRPAPRGARNGVGAGGADAGRGARPATGWFRPGYDSAIPLTPWTDAWTAAGSTSALPALPRGVRRPRRARRRAGRSVRAGPAATATTITPRGVAVFAVSPSPSALFTAAITPVDPVFGLSPAQGALAVGARRLHRGRPRRRALLSSRRAAIRPHRAAAVGRRRGRRRRVAADPPDVPCRRRPCRPAGGVARRGRRSATSSDAARGRRHRVRSTSRASSSPSRTRGPR